MNRLLLGLLMFVAAATATMAQKVVETTPARPQENGGVTITYRPALDARNGEFPMKDVTEVWAYTGARAVPIAQGDGKYYEKAPWNDLKNFAELKLKNNGDGTHTLVIENIKAFYGVDAADPVRELLFVFRNVDGTVQGSDQLVAIDPAGGATTAKLRLINGVATSENADVIVDRATEAQITNIGFQLASAYRDVPSGAAVNIKAKKSGAPAPIYADVDKAREVRRKLEKAGLKTYTHVAETKDGKRTRVRLGPFATREEADKAADKAKQLEFTPAVLTL